MKAKFLFNVLVLSIALCNAQSTNEDSSSPGLVTKISSLDFNTTYETIRNRIEKNPNLKILLELDHSKNAASVDLTLNPTKLILFGNPKIGTGLMADNQTASIDLPQKIIVFENEKGEVVIAYNDPYYVRDRHGLKDSGALSNVSFVLDKLTTIK